MRRTQLLTLFGLCFFIGSTIYFMRNHHPPHPITGPPPESTKVLPPSTSSSHPIHQLITKAEQDFEALKKRQSQTLSEAVAEYRKRYKIPPPPNFDKWFEYAKKENVQLIDEYDTIYHALLPFWGLPPSVIRARAREALGFDNALVGIYVRTGQIVSATGGSEWLQKAVLGMVSKHREYLPDMDLAFNVHDEPRVIVPHDDLSRLVATAIDKAMPIALKNQAPKNVWSERPKDVDDGKRYNEVRFTRFNKFAHQPTWTNSRMSCSPQSPARALDENYTDDPSSFAFSDLGFISNKTAFSDICLTPSLRERYGFFNRPNAYNIVHDLFPIFSQSKVSSYQDILYPSPWYWSNKVPYNEKDDMAWDEKRSLLYWRGSTTGGFSRDGDWRHQHRQLFVERINALDKARIFENSSVTGTTGWRLKEVQRPDYKQLFDVKFSHVGQCDPGDCDAQREYFEVVNPDKQHDAWKHKYLLDIDGNAFSGRFYAFLRSTSLVYKMAFFREWHEEWIRPWLHYIPLGQKGDEYTESVRYFAQEQNGKIQAPKIATQGRDWAGKVLRQEDLEVWLFRLLLEYVSSFLMSFQAYASD